MPGRIITEAKTQPDALSIVRFGTVSLKAKGMKEQKVKQGDLFGEMALLGLTMDGLRMRTAKAVTVVEISSLSAKDFEELLVVRPRKSSKNAALVDSRGAEIKLLRGRSLGSKIVPSAQIVFQGSLVLSEIHERRANQQS
jgi:CRP-like cAMP-binding protein